MLKMVLRRLRGKRDEPLPLPVQDPALSFDANGNRIRLADGLSSQPGFQLTVEGRDNYLDIRSPAVAGQISIHAAGSAHVSIGSDCIMNHLIVYAGPGAIIEIGARTKLHGLVRLLAHEPRRIRLGDDCLFAGNIDVTASDMHSIVDVKSGRRINHARDVLIGDRVWVGQGAHILKGAQIGNGSVIGANAVITKVIPPNSVAAGNPARVVRHGVRWVEELL